MQTCRKFLMLLIMCLLVVGEGQAKAAEKRIEPKIAFPDRKASDIRQLMKITFITREGEPRICSGLVIENGAVLTAGHCACGLPGTYMGYLPVSQPGGFLYEKVDLGDPIFFERSNCSENLRELVGKDIALLLYSEDAIDADFAKVPFISPFRVSRALPSKLMVAGYGRDETGELPKEPFAADIGILTMFCTKGKVARSKCAPFREFALGQQMSETRKDSCGGDSGGPVFYRDPNKILYLVGITSRGLTGVANLPSLDCGGGGIYTTVAHKDIVQWLRNNGINVEVFR